MSELSSRPSARTKPPAAIPLPLMVGTFVLLWASAFAVGKIAHRRLPAVSLSVRALPRRRRADDWPCRSDRHPLDLEQARCARFRRARRRQSGDVSRHRIHRAQDRLVRNGCADPQRQSDRRRRLRRVPARRAHDLAQAARSSARPRRRRLHRQESPDARHRSAGRHSAHRARAARLCRRHHSVQVVRAEGRILDRQWRAEPRLRRRDGAVRGRLRKRPRRRADLEPYRRLRLQRARSSRSSPICSGSAS